MSVPQAAGSRPAGGRTTGNDCSQAMTSTPPDRCDPNLSWGFRRFVTFSDTEASSCAVAQPLAPGSDSVWFRHAVRTCLHSDPVRLSSTQNWSELLLVAGYPSRVHPMPPAQSGP